MDAEEYRKRGKELVDYIADYLENIRGRRVYPSVAPGYMRALVPDSAPEDGQPWEEIFNDIERVIMPGVTHWQSPHMHAYFPALNSFPSLLGDMLADAINCLGFTWASSPAATELETIVMNWLGKLLGLPEEFLHEKGGSPGGGVIQTTASEATLVCLLAGRSKAIRQAQESYKNTESKPENIPSAAELNARLVGYCSDQAHSSVEKAALIGLVKMRYVPSNHETLAMNPEKLQEMIDQDKNDGLIPFWVCVTLGTTGACAFDDLSKIGPICRENDLWLHVDAAYAGSAFVCPEFRHWLNGINHADSFAFNPSKWLMVHFDCTAMWVKNSGSIHRTFNVEPLYLQHENSGLAIDYMHWQIPLSKRFRALKLWFVLRNYGRKGLQEHIRKGVRLAAEFEKIVRSDPLFEVPVKRHLGLVAFRLRGDDQPTEQLLRLMNSRGRVHCVPAQLPDKRYIIRFTVTSARTTMQDIEEDWREIRHVAELVIGENDEILPPTKQKVMLKETRARGHGTFGTSLLLANSPMSPKVVNGSFAAVYVDQKADSMLSDYLSRLRITPTDSPAMRRRIRGILVSGRKQYSLDSRLDLVQGGLATDGSSGHRPRSEGSSSNAPPLPTLQDALEDDSPTSSTMGEQPIRERRSRSAERTEEIILKNTNSCCKKCGHRLAVPQNNLVLPNKN